MYRRNMFLQFYFLQLFEKQIKVAWKYLEKCDISKLRSW